MQTESFLFRQKLYDNFKQSGLLSQLQTTLRTNLLRKLQQPRPTQPQSTNQPLHLNPKYINTIISQYLQSKQYQYSLAIFQPQTNLNSQDMLTYNQLAQIINFTTSNPLPSFLESLVQEWHRYKALDIKQRSSQTDFDEPLSKKLQIIDKQYMHQIDYWKINRPKPIPTQPSAYQIQQQFKIKFNIEKQKVRQQLQLTIKQQIQTKYQNKYQFRIRQIEKKHQARINQIKNRQKSILDSLERKKNHLEDKAKQLKSQQIQMIDNYNNKIKEMELYYHQKLKDIENLQKQYQKKQLQLKAKKKQYQDSIRLVKQKIVEESST